MKRHPDNSRMQNQNIDELTRLKKEMDESGFCIVENLIDPETIAEIHNRIDTQAKAEQDQGVTAIDQVQSENDRNQWVYLLINKGDIFQTLLDHQMVQAIVKHVLGPHYLLSDFAATITHPGNKQMGLHIDQWWMPEPRMPEEPHVRCGSINRENVNKGVPVQSNLPINPPVVCNVLWMVSDFTIENGATRIVPRSHLSGISPEPYGDYDTINATGKAGSAVIFEGRTWHSADLNSSSAPRYGITTYYGAPQFRQMLNFTYATRKEVLEGISDKTEYLLGFKPWGGYGATGDQSADKIVKAEDQVGVLGE
jgi:ectoine hydroxylase-related dioxygenase (phytanoyl-CoA dioxygenase family)